MLPKVRFELPIHPVNFIHALTNCPQRRAVMVTVLQTFFHTVGLHYNKRKVTNLYRCDGGTAFGQIAFSPQTAKFHVGTLGILRSSVKYVCRGIQTAL